MLARDRDPAERVDGEVTLRATVKLLAPGGSLCQAALLKNRDGFDPHVHYFDHAVPVQISGEIAAGRSPDLRSPRV